MPQRLPVREIDPKQPPVTDSRELDLYEKREKIYTRKIEGFFQRIVALPHPRFVMQYRRKRMAEYIAKYREALFNAPQ